MARKSAASVKPKFKQPELPPIEETFDNAKQVFINTAEVAAVVAGRIDNLVNIRKAAYDFWGDELNEKLMTHKRVEQLKEWQGMTIDCYEDILDIVKQFELKEFLKEDMKDYFQPIMPVPNDIANEKDLFEAYLIAGIVKPWGEKMTQLHHQMLDEQAARKPVE